MTHTRRTPPMRLALAVVALVAAVGLVRAGEARCMLHVNGGATPYVQEGDFGPMTPATGANYRKIDVSKDDEVGYLDTKTPGGPWICGLHSPFFRLSDVKLYGDCTHMRVNELD